MTSVEELESAVVALNEKEYRKFRLWFYERDWDKWDNEIETDSKTGRLDFLVGEAMDEKKKKRLGDL